jgi:hypothetical protein
MPERGKREAPRSCEPLQIEDIHNRPSFRVPLRGPGMTQVKVADPHST